MAGATVDPVPAAFAAGVTNTKGVWLIRTGDGIGLFLHPSSAVRIAFAGPDIQLQFLGNRTSGRVRLTLGATHRDVDLYSVQTRRWLISMHAPGNGPNVLTILDLGARGHVGNAVLSRFHVFPAKSPTTATVAHATINAVQAAFADGVTNTHGVWLIKTVDGVGLFLHPSSAVRVAFAGPDIQLQFLGNHTSGRVRLTLGATHRDVDLYSVQTRRWLISMHTKGNGPHVLTILDLATTKAGYHVGTAVLSELHVLPAAAEPGSIQ